jgi:hypothetical protein
MGLGHNLYREREHDKKIIKENEEKQWKEKGTKNIKIKKS